MSLKEIQASYLIKELVVQLMTIIKDVFIGGV